jgi:hypothetical protein
MDTQELYKIFRQRLEDALKSKENFKGKNQIKFIEIVDGFCCFHYRGQDFTVEWWTYEQEQCLECSFYCREVQTTEIDFDFESFDYSLDLEMMETEEDIDSNIYEIVEGIKNCYIGSNVNKILNMAEKMARDIEDLDGNEGDNKFMLQQALQYYDLID